MNALIEKANQMLDHPDAAKLILRLSFGFMFLLHGIHKIESGTGFIQGMFTNLGLPGWFAYAVYLGEVVAPIMWIVGWYTRIASVFIIGTSLVVVGLMHMGDFFTLTKVGAWSVESVAVFFFPAIALLLMGSGKYALKRD
ncbi:DoxX family protein [Vibrio porteresiae]|uniref:DoxX family protein n=1 Tax=Vibrio porteresiae DSM 19223 TaxID=1123496 RepID=A0ABZ0QEQ0_9VIBR|nr:DoxX family protein [Vibrio porteresiae]WPC74938.1 DoxX family protein [Vibrio porteresiae DSM 19223]